MKFGDKQGDQTLEHSSEFSSPQSASRARNRTIMLSPDVTGQVRSLLQVDARSNGSQATGLAKGVGATSEFSSPFGLKPRAPEQGKAAVSGMNGKTEEFPPIGTKQTYSAVEKSDLLNADQGHSGTVEMARPFSSGRSSTHPTATMANSRPNSVARPSHPVSPAIDDSNMGRVPPSGTKEGTGDQQRRGRRSTTFDSDRSVLLREKIEDIPLQRPEKQHEVAGRVVGFLVSFDRVEDGEVTLIRAGRWIVSSDEGVRDNVLVVKDPSISSSHAIIKTGTTGEVLILDQLSDFGTGVQRGVTSSEMLAEDCAITVQHGDIVRFGKRYFVFCAVPKIQITGDTN